MSCAVCSLNIDVNNSTTIPCGCKFHATCFIQTVTNSEFNCPECNFEMFSENQKNRMRNNVNRKVFNNFKNKCIELDAKNKVRKEKRKKELEAIWSKSDSDVEPIWATNSDSDSD